MNLGEGKSPQAIHAKDDLLRVFYLADDNTVHGLYDNPEKGLYDDLVFEEKGRVSPDESVSFPSIKRVAHYGAYGFWSAEGDHKFVVFMMPTDISKTLIDGNVQFSIGSEVSSLSCDLLNIRGELLNRYRALVTPGTKLEVGFSIGDSGEVALGVFYVDSASVSFPDEKVSISARNAIGKLLKEQTFDENTAFDYGSLHDNIEAILELAEVENYFVGDPGTNEELEFDPDTTLLEGIRYAITNLTDWKIGETMDGVLGIAVSTDARFDPPGVYTFERDRTCWNYSIEYDDADAASRVCVYSKQTNDETIYVYKEVKFNRFWEQPHHRTLYVQTVDDATEEECQNIADTMAESLAVSGRAETFAGLFTPQLVLGDEIHVLNENQTIETIGTITDLTHNFGKGGSFTVDSGGRRWRRRLKDLISSAAESPALFTGPRSSTPIVEIRNTLAIEESGATSITGTLATAGSSLVVASLIHRSALGATPEGWILLYTSPGINNEGSMQYVSVFYLLNPSATLAATFTQTDSARLYLNLIAFSGTGVPSVSQGAATINAQQIQVGKTSTEAVLWVFHRFLWSTGSAVWKVDGVGEEYILQRPTNGRLLNVLDKTPCHVLTISETAGFTNDTEYFGIRISGIEISQLKMSATLFANADNFITPDCSCGKADRPSNN